MSFKPLPREGSYRSVSQNQGKIPAIFHFIWIGSEDGPEPPVDFSPSWGAYHPKHRIIHWRGPMIRKAIGMHFPFLLESYEGLSSCPWLQSIGARVAILALMGGIYVDYDLEACGPLNRLAYPSASCILVANAKPLWGESRIRRGIMAACPSHPFFMAALKALAHQVKTPIKSYKSSKAQALREILKNVYDKHKDQVTLVSDALLIPYGAMMPMHKGAIGVYRSPPSHHWERWYHKAYRKYHCFCKANPAAGRLLTYFIMGLITGIILNVIFILVRSSINSKRKKAGKDPI